MYLKDSMIIVIKIGSSLLIDNNKKVRKKWLFEFSKDVQDLVKQNKKIIIVSSGAIAMGCKKLNLSKKNLKLDKSQAVASIGQIELMNLFSEIFVTVLISAICYSYSCRWGFIPTIKFYGRTGELYA